MAYDDSSWGGLTLHRLVEHVQGHRHRAKRKPSYTCGIDSMPIDDLSLTSEYSVKEVLAVEKPVSPMQVTVRHVLRYMASIIDFPTGTGYICDVRFY